MKKKFISLLICCTFLNLTGCSSSSNSDAPATETTTDQSIVQTQESTSKIAVTDFLTCPEFTAGQGTSDMVLQIALTAKEYAPNLTDEQADEIIDIIRVTGHKFYNNLEDMEKFMWYACLLDYKYDDSDPRSSAGTHLYQAIKYVYRNVDTIFDEATHNKLIQLDEDLAAIK